MKIYSYILLALFSSQLISAPIVVTVGTDDDCDFQMVQSAVDSGAINMDIRVTNQLVIVENISILDGDEVILLSGGYDNCLDASLGILDDFSPFTYFDGLNLDSVLSISIFNTNYFNISISGFKIYNGLGGIIVTSGPANETLIVNISYVDIYNNTSSAIIGEGTGTEVSFNNGKIYDNSSFVGGGISCFESELNLGENVAIYANLARQGGGIYARNCDVNILAGDNNALDDLERGIFNNHALDSGAGVYLNQTILVGLGPPAHPVSISGNTITDNQFSGLGGGVYMSSGSSMQMTNVRLDGNSATVAGGAIATMHDDIGLQSPSFFLIRNENGCEYAEICSSLSSNSISDNGYGSVIAQDGGGFGYVIQASIKNNGSSNAMSLFKLKNSSQLLLSSDLIVSNSTALHLFDQEDESEVYIQYSTLSDNVITNYFNVQYDNDNPQVLEVTGTIIKNGEATIANLNNDNGNHDAQIKCSIVENDDASGVVQNLSVAGDPSFVGNGNYKLKPNSIAIDRSCSNIGEFDIARYDIRNQDHNADGVADLGAYEYIDADDVIYKNSFTQILK